MATAEEKTEVLLEFFRVFELLFVYDPMLLMIVFLNFLIFAFQYGQLPFRLEFLYIQLILIVLQDVLSQHEIDAEPYHLADMVSQFWN